MSGHKPECELIIQYRGLIGFDGDLFVAGEACRERRVRSWMSPAKE